MVYQRGGISFFAEAVIAFFTLFFLFREGSSIGLRAASFLPLRADQVDRLFTGISNSIIANVYGCLAVGATQGTLLGLAFWVLGLPSPVLWGLVTALFSLIPVIGSAAVWGPAVIVLMVAGPWWKAVILLVWGAAVVGQIDSLVHQDDIARTVRLRLITRVHAGLRPVDGGLEPSPTSKVGLQSFVSLKASGETQLRPAD